MKRRILSFLPVIFVLIYYAVGAFVRGGCGRPEAFIYDKKYGDILKFLVIILPFYLMGINLPRIKKSGVVTYFEMFLVEILWVAGILLGDRYILTIEVGGMADIFWNTAYIWAFSGLSTLWWLIYFSLNRKKGKTLFNFLPLIITVAEFLMYATTKVLRLADFEFIWLDVLSTIILMHFVINRLFSPIIFPIYLVILNRDELKAKKHLLKTVGIMFFYNLLSVGMMLCVMGEATVNFIFGIFDIGLYLCEGLTFVISYLGLVLYYKRKA